jgi:hypothetical protein
MPVDFAVVALKLLTLEVEGVVMLVEELDPQAGSRDRRDNGRQPVPPLRNAAGWLPVPRHQRRRRADVPRASAVQRRGEGLIGSGNWERLTAHVTARHLHA